MNDQFLPIPIYRQNETIRFTNSNLLNDLVFALSDPDSYAAISGREVYIGENYHIWPSENVNKAVLTSILSSKIFAFFSEKLLEINDKKGGPIKNKITATVTELYYKFGIEGANRQKHFRAAFNDAVDALRNIYINTKAFGDDAGFEVFLTKARLKKGILSVEFEESKAAAMISGRIVVAPIELLQIDNRNSLKYLLLFHLSLRYSDDQNVMRDTHNIISIKSLVNQIPPLSIAYKNSAAQSRHTQLIIEPLKRCLNDLKNEGVLASWDWCEGKKADLSERWHNAPAKQWIEKLYIRYTFSMQPDAEALRNDVARRRENKAADKNKSAKHKRSFKKRIVEQGKLF